MGKNHEIESLTLVYKQPIIELLQNKIRHYDKLFGETTDTEQTVCLNLVMVLNDIYSQIQEM